MQFHHRFITINTKQAMRKSSFTMVTIFRESQNLIQVHTRSIRKSYNFDIYLTIWKEEITCFIEQTTRSRKKVQHELKSVSLKQNNPIDVGVCFQEQNATDFIHVSSKNNLCPDVGLCHGQGNKKEMNHKKILKQNTADLIHVSSRIHK